MSLAQSTTIDFLLAFFLIVLVATTIGVYAFTQHGPSPTHGEVVALAGAIMNPYPEQWNASTVIIPGFAGNHVLNRGQLVNFTALGTGTVQALLGISDSYFVNVTGRGLSTTVGDPPDANAADQSVVRRYAAYNGSVAEIEVIVWRA